MSNSNKIIVHKNRTNTLKVNLGFSVAGESFKSEIRTQPDQTSPLIVTWAIVVNNSNTGDMTLTLKSTQLANIPHKIGYMDIKRTSGTEPLSVFDEPLEVEFRGTVTV